MNIVTEIEVIKFLKEKITDSIEIPATIPFVQSGILNSGKVKKLQKDAV